MKKVLIIAYSFPPVARDRSTRTLKFVRYLSKFGWQPVVLTVKDPIVPNYDFSLLKDIPEGVKVVRTPSLEMQSFRKRQPAYRKQIAGQKSLGKILSSFLVPDSRVGWIPFAVLNGRRIAREEPIDIIYASGEPFSVFISAAIIKRLTGAPLILDFRDDWVGFNPLFREKKGWVNNFELFLERFVVKSADAVIAVNDNIKEDIKMRHYKNNCGAWDKFHTIYNGFDPQDFSGIKESPDMAPDALRIVYIGSLYARRSAEFFLSALRSLIIEKPYIKSKLRVFFAGNKYNDNELFCDEILKGVVIEKNFLPYQDSIALLKSAHLLLFIEDQVPVSDRIITGKIFDYMGARKPILALANEGPVKSMVNSLRLGRVVAGENIDEIKSSLSDFFREFSENGEISYRGDVNGMINFERSSQAMALAQIMDTLLLKNEIRKK